MLYQCIFLCVFNFTSFSGKVDRKNVKTRKIEWLDNADCYEHELVAIFESKSNNMNDCLTGYKCMYHYDYNNNKYFIFCR